MALRNQPYIPLYVQDYLTDEKLNMCSSSTQGIYIKILCIFHKSERYGGILFKQTNKQNFSRDEYFAWALQKQIGFSDSEIKNAIDELVEFSVLIIDGDFLYQKRMVKDFDISTKRSESAKKGGGNPNILHKQKSKQKVKQKPENEIEYENEDDNVNNNNGVKIEKVELTPLEIKFNEFLKFRKEIKHPVTKTQEQALKTKIWKLSNQDIQTAIDIIDQSIANGWQGVFEIKQNNFNNNQNGNSKNNQTELIGRIPKDQLEEFRRPRDNAEFK